MFNCPSCPSHNVRTIKKYYPGYRMRLYYRLTDNEMAMERLCQLACEEEILDLCDISRNPMVLNASSYYPLVWRFLPALDAQVDLMLSRDLDSDITAREQAAVSEFLQQENKTFHIMRDHKDHTIEILGGTWAVKLDHGLTRHLMVKGMKKMLQDPTVLNIGKDRGLDQFLLVRYVWPLARKARIIFAHDSFHCMSYPFSIGFPTQREQSEAGNFIGAVRTVNEPLKMDKFQSLMSKL
ncbi:hypothetical protein TCAL_07377 [Tigriopus californicus]|uniref:Uncharacterized protein n=1 Tax=Tigriopus californicus TaxID=6832 RepID=A0A553PND1_TIGCA|nr:hypothetical protein TCAL_07377 [Tigriopus californicus]